MASRAQLRRALVVSGLQAALDGGELVVGMHVRHGDSCMQAEISRTARRCEPLARYVMAVAEYARQIGSRTLFIATDSEVVLRDAAALREFRVLSLPNVSRSVLSTPIPGIRRQPTHA